QIPEARGLVLRRGGGEVAGGVEGDGGDGPGVAGEFLLQVARAQVPAADDPVAGAGEAEAAVLADRDGVDVLVGPRGPHPEGVLLGRAQGGNRGAGGRGGGRGVGGGGGRVPAPVQHDGQ